MKELDFTSYRFSETTFRSYEPALNSMMLSWPKPVIVSRPGYTNTTIAARLRDILIAFDQRQTWNPTLWAFYQANKARISVRHGTYVTIGDHSSSTPNATALPQTTITITEPDHDIISALCLLHSKRVLTSPTTIHRPLCDINAIASAYDVLISPCGGSSYELQ